MGKKLEPLTIRERYLANRCGIGEKMTCGIRRKTYQVRRLLKYRQTHPAIERLRELHGKLKDGSLSLSSIDGELYHVACMSGRRYISNFPLNILVKYVEVEEDIKGMSDKQIRQRMVLEAI